jgi:hypothetical protein
MAIRVGPEPLVLAMFELDERSALDARFHAIVAVVVEE